MDFCDLDCKYASFPDSSAVDGSRSCRTFIALYCKRRKSLVHKNLPCGEKETKGVKQGKKKNKKVRREEGTAAEGKGTNFPTASDGEREEEMRAWISTPPPSYFLAFLPAPSPFP